MFGGREDVSVMMDLEKKSAEHPAQDETIIALKLIATYAQYGLIPVVLPPPAIDPPLPIERVPVQQGTDLAYLKAMAERFSYVFYVSAGPVPFTNTAYWGPPKRLDVPQKALTVNMGAETNVESLRFSNNALTPTLASGQVQAIFDNAVRGEFHFLPASQIPNRRYVAASKALVGGRADLLLEAARGSEPAIRGGLVDPHSPEQMGVHEVEQAMPRARRAPPWTHA